MCFDYFYSFEKKTITTKKKKKTKQELHKAYLFHEQKHKRNGFKTVNGLNAKCAGLALIYT